MSSKLPVTRALASDVRLEILKLLYQKPRDIEDLAKNHLKLQPITVRHHIQCLEEAGIIESYEDRKGLAGRPKTYYKLVKKLPTINFPERRYYDFSKAMISSLLRNFGEEKTTKIIEDVGRDMGEGTAKYLAMTNNIKKWTPKEFAEIYIEKFLAEDFGAEPQIIERSDNRVVYRTNNCPLFELSQEMPSLMCEKLHAHFNESIMKAMGENLIHVQTSCMGKGDNCCEHVFEWTPENPTHLEK